MFRAIANKDLTALPELAHLFIKGDRKAAALLALDHFVSRSLSVLKSYRIQEMSLFLAEFLEYTRLLDFFISHPDPLSIHSIKKLFRIREVSNTEYRLDIGSFLHKAATDQSSVTSLSKNSVAVALRKYLGTRLREHFTKENDLCSKAPVFSQCLTFIVNDGCCSRASCPQEHAELAVLDPERYNVRLGIHLQQISILQMMYSINPQLREQSEYVMTCLCCIDNLLKIT